MIVSRQPAIRRAGYRPLSCSAKTSHTRNGALTFVDAARDVQHGSWKMNSSLPYGDCTEKYSSKGKIGAAGSRTCGHDRAVSKVEQHLPAPLGKSPALSRADKAILKTTDELQSRLSTLSHFAFSLPRRGEEENSRGAKSLRGGLHADQHVGDQVCGCNRCQALTVRINECFYAHWAFWLRWSIEHAFGDKQLRELFIVRAINSLCKAQDQARALALDFLGQIPGWCFVHWRSSPCSRGRTLLDLRNRLAHVFLVPFDVLAHGMYSVLALPRAQ